MSLRCKADGWEEKELGGPHGGLYLVSGIYEADDTWHYGDYDPTPEAIIATADTIQGVPFAPPRCWSGSARLVAPRMWRTSS